MKSINNRTITQRAVGAGFLKEQLLKAALIPQELPWLQLELEWKEPFMQPNATFR
jgi:hypothetical protein